MIKQTPYKISWISGNGKNTCCIELDDIDDGYPMYMDIQEIFSKYEKGTPIHVEQKKNGLEIVEWTGVVEQEI